MSAAGPDLDPAFVLLADGDGPCAGIPQAVLEPLSDRCSARLGFEVAIETAALDQSLTGAPSIGRKLSKLRERGKNAAFLVPATPALSLRAKQGIVEATREARREHPSLAVHYDDADPCHPLVVGAFVDATCQALSRMQIAGPNQSGVLLVASGDGDPDSRAQSYRLMRLLWEQVSAARGEVAFLRHAATPMPEQLRRCLAGGGAWVVVPQLLFECEHLDYAKILFDDFRREHELGDSWQMTNVVGDHPNLTGWLEHRILELWRSHRKKLTTRMPSARTAEAQPTYVYGPRGKAELAAHSPSSSADAPHTDAPHEGIIAEVGDPADLGKLFETIGLSGERFFVKVTWHGYAPGTYTDPVALDSLLSALPGRAVIVEGHTASRNSGGATWDWENDSKEHRAWIRREEREYLERTGLAEVMARHNATYLNVTEAYWDGQCAPRIRVEELLEARGVTLRFPEVADYVPAVFLDYPSAPFISFARFKGPTRLSISNAFGLIPTPLRTAWHGPNIRYFARVCCDMAKLYGCLFDLYGVVESLNVAVRWDRNGLYRSRWGNYDLVPRPGLVTMSRGLVAADVLASRLQGQDVRRSAFFETVQEEVGFPTELATRPISDDLVRRFV